MLITRRELSEHSAFKWSPMITLYQYRDEPVRRLHVTRETLTRFFPFECKCGYDNWQTFEGETFSVLSFESLFSEN